MFGDNSDLRSERLFRLEMVFCIDDFSGLVFGFTVVVSLSFRRSHCISSLYVSCDGFPPQILVAAEENYNEVFCVRCVPRQFRIYYNLQHIVKLELQTCILVPES